METKAIIISAIAGVVGYAVIRGLIYYYSKEAERKGLNNKEDKPENKSDFKFSDPLKPKPQNDYYN